MTTDQKIDELLRMVKGHDERFSQIDARFDQGLAKMDAKIDQVHASLTEAIQAFAGDLYKFEKRLPRPKKKSLSRTRSS